MSNETVTYSLEAVLTRIEGKIDFLQRDVNERLNKLEIVGLRQKTNREKLQLQSPLGIYFEKPKIAETQIYQGKS
ncbi:hypothetical protein myaer102_18470 [Microcystis viridis NIES-102]|uniref:Uncharacterized protein n=1 Tax=Microcystis viridis NIES-102 TaxID=213615 RepID=A0A3G9JTY9_MICVR|nr:hypothetical protein myaer102_18470 [Microcystis viridis NIES-102]